MAGSWEDGIVTRLASWPVFTSTQTVPCTLANKVLQAVLHPETLWAGRFCYGFGTPILQLICAFLHSMFLLCCWQTLQHYWAEISLDYAFLISLLLHSVSYCIAKLEPVLSTGQCLLEIIQNYKLNQKQSSRVNRHLTLLHLTLPAWNGVLCSLS